jgi:endonuclease I
MYKLNEYGKIIINEIEIYYGCVIEYNEQAGIVKLYVLDWKTRFNTPKEFYEIVAPARSLVIKYGAGAIQ